MKVTYKGQECDVPEWATEQAYKNGYAKGYADGKAEVVHGDWSIVERNKSKRMVIAECSECNAMFELPMFAFGMNYNYCPNCGAKIDGGNEDG